MLLDTYSIFSYVADGGNFGGAMTVFKSLFQGFFSILRYVGLFASVMAVIWSAAHIVFYSRKPKQLAEHVAILGEDMVTIVFIAGIVGIIVAILSIRF